MSSKPKWSCSSCGMYSSRRSSVKRHIVTLHRGQGISIPFADYIAGIRNGFYPSANTPLFKKAEGPSVEETELEKEIARRAVTKLLDTVPSTAVELVVNSSIPNLLSSPRFKETNVSGLGKLAKIYIGKANAKLSDEIFGRIQNPCQICGLPFNVPIKYGDNIETLDFRHDFCKAQSKFVNSVFGSIISYKDHPMLQYHNKMKFKNQILKWTFNNCALLVTKIGNLSNETVISMGSDSTKNVKLNSKIESIVSFTEFDLFSCDWLDRAIDSGWTNLEEEELDQFLNFVPNKTWFYLNLSQQGNQTDYFVMLFFPYVNKRPVVQAG